MLIRPDPVFHLCLGPAQPEWLFEVRPGCQMKSMSSDQTNKTQAKENLCIVVNFVWTSGSKMHIKMSPSLKENEYLIMKSTLDVKSVTHLMCKWSLKSPVEVQGSIY